MLDHVVKDQEIDLVLALRIMIVNDGLDGLLYLSKRFSLSVLGVEVIELYEVVEDELLWLGKTVL